MITAQDLKYLAERLVGRHGYLALKLADQAVLELEVQGESARAEAWRALKSVVIDVLENRLPADQVTIH